MEMLLGQLLLDIYKKKSNAYFFLRGFLASYKTSKILLGYPNFLRN